MNTYHKHEGVLSNGKPKTHPISTVHKDKKAQYYHNQSLKKQPQKQIGNFTSKTPKKIVVKVDEEGYISINMNSVEQNGVRITGLTPGKVHFAKDGSIEGIQFDK